MIRPFKSGDEKYIAVLENECFSSPWSENAVLESYQNNTTFFVAEENSNIVGYAGLQLVLDEGYVTNIAVTKSARKKGIGNALVNELLNFAVQNKLAFVSLEVRESNLPAITLYKKCGFAYMGKRKNFYSSPTEDAIILTKEFN